MRRGITMAEVAEHCSREDCWMVLGNRVYNITRYLDFHPGGAQILLKAAGTDGTALFQRYHPWVNVQGLLGLCFLGLVER